MNCTIALNALKRTLEFLTVLRPKRMILKWPQVAQRNVFYCLTLCENSGDKNPRTLPKWECTGIFMFGGSPRSNYAVWQSKSYTLADVREVHRRRPPGNGSNLKLLVSLFLI